ncbi:DUF4845 domain-containing protein [Porticoccaceae bacterium]|jgi:hypothetical protein|nr:DUF4845 domain-containing protein [Porticoccaceae bacterium]
MKQHGATLTSTIISVFLVGFLISLIFKIGPHYLDNRIVASALQQVGQSGIEDRSSEDIRRKIGDFFTINNVRDIKATEVEIERSVKGVKITLNYEKRIEMFANVDVVLKFNNQYDSAEQAY